MIYQSFLLTTCIPRFSFPCLCISNLRQPWHVSMLPILLNLFFYLSTHSSIYLLIHLLITLPTHTLGPRAIQLPLYSLPARVFTHLSLHLFFCFFLFVPVSPSAFTSATLSITPTASLLRSRCFLPRVQLSPPGLCDLGTPTSSW